MSGNKYGGQTTPRSKSARRPKSSKRRPWSQRAQRAKWPFPGLPIGGKNSEPPRCRVSCRRRCASRGASVGWSCGLGVSDVSRLEALGRAISPFGRAGTAASSGWTLGSELILTEGLFDPVVVPTHGLSGLEIASPKSQRFESQTPKSQLVGPIFHEDCSPQTGPNRKIA